MQKIFSSEQNEIIESKLLFSNSENILDRLDKCKDISMYIYAAKLMIQ